MNIDVLAQRISAPTTSKNNTGPNNEDAAAEGDRAIRLTRIANLVAAGRMDLPIEAPSEDLRVITQAVRRHHCFALVRHIAHCIARELAHLTTKEMTDD